MAKILGCLPKEFDNFVTSWSLLSENVSLESFLEKLTNTERSFAERTDDISHEVFKAQSKSTNRQVKKAIDKKFQGKCHKCGKKGHIQRDCWSKSEKPERTAAPEEKKESKNHKSESGLSASSVFESSENDRIIADSGANIHLTRNIEWFSSLRKLTSPIVLNVADGKTLRTTHIGNIEIEKSIVRHEKNKPGKMYTIQRT